MVRSRMFSEPMVLNLSIAFEITHPPLTVDDLCIKCKRKCSPSTCRLTSTENKYFRIEVNRNGRASWKLELFQKFQLVHWYHFQQRHQRKSSKFKLHRLPYLSLPRALYDFHARVHVHPFSKARSEPSQMNR